MMTFDINKILKLGRNDKCWCGSDLKFKRCHKDRELQKPFTTGEIMAHGNDLSKIATCYAPIELHPECSNIIKAHTVSKSSGLIEIADDTNHVLGLKQNLSSLDKNEGNLKLEKIGINNASTFRGFCAKHDKLLFSCFEDKPFIGTEKQCVALTYRSLAKEIYDQECLLSNAVFMRDMDKGSPLIHQLKFQDFMKKYKSGIKESIDGLSIIQDNLTHYILKRNYNPYSFLIIESSLPIPVVVSSLIEPTHDFKGTLIQSASKLRRNPEHLVLNAFSSHQKGFVLFGWLQTAEAMNTFINSLLDLNEECIFSALITLFLSSSQNSYVSPNWWNSLNDVQKDKITSLLPMGANPLLRIPSDVLVDDGIQFLGWNAEKIYRF